MGALHDAGGAAGHAQRVRVPHVLHEDHGGARDAVAARADQRGPVRPGLPVQAALRPRGPGCTRAPCRARTLSPEETYYGLGLFRLRNAA